MGNEGTTRDRGAGRSERQVLWEAPGARSCAPCAGAELPGGEKYFVQKQMAVTGILLRLVFALGNSGWHFMAVRKLALPHR